MALHLCVRLCYSSNGNTLSATLVPFPPPPPPHAITNMHKIRHRTVHFSQKLWMHNSMQQMKAFKFQYGSCVRDTCSHSYKHSLRCRYPMSICHTTVITKPMEYWSMGFHEIFCLNEPFSKMKFQRCVLRLTIEDPDSLTAFITDWLLLDSLSIEHLLKTVFGWHLFSATRPLPICAIPKWF